MRDEKEERKKQARSNKQTRQSNTAHPGHMYLIVGPQFGLEGVLTELQKYLPTLQVHVRWEGEGEGEGEGGGI